MSGKVLKGLSLFAVAVFCVAGLTGCSGSENAEPVIPSGSPGAGPGPGGPGGMAGDSLSIAVGATAKVEPPADTDAASLTWSSSDEKVATVSDSGEVTSVAEGSAVVTGKDADGKTVVTKKVSVTAAMAMDHEMPEAGSEDK